MPTIVRWNGHEVPDELRSLPAGRYVIEPVDEVPILSEDEAAGLEAAIASIRAGEGVDVDEARRRIEGALHR